MISLTVLLIIITAAISIMAFSRYDMQTRLIFNPYVIRVRKEWYRFFSHGFIHADYNHLIVNMLTLLFFGISVEKQFEEDFGALGRLLFLLLYLTAIGVASISSYIKHKNHSYYNSLGASGAVSAVLYASILLNPLTSIYLLFIPIPIPGIIYGVLYLLYSSYMSKRGGDNIGHDAHFYGAVYGFVLPILFKPAYIVEFVYQIRTALGMY